jgi:hypothetical protein
MSLGYFQFYDCIPGRAQHPYVSISHVRRSWCIRRFPTMYGSLVTSNLIRETTKINLLMRVTNLVKRKKLITLWLLTVILVDLSFNMLISTTLVLYTSS